MAEIAAAAWAVEEVISTGVQAGVAGYAVAKPTMPVKAVWSRLATTTDDHSASSLTRSHHTATLLGGKAYIFGGRVGAGLADNDLHVCNLSAGSPDYHALPALPAHTSGPVPSPRASHAACAHEQHLVVYGGCAPDGSPVENDATIWLFDTQQSTWSPLRSEVHVERQPSPRSHAHIFSHGRSLILYGGKDAGGTLLSDTWHFDFPTKTWNQLPTAPAAAPSAAFSGNTLYLISQGGDLASHLHCLDVKLYAEHPPEWITRDFPTNPLTPGPAPRTNGSLLPVSTGHGRNFLLYFFGDRPEASRGGTAENPPPGEASSQLGDMWTLQLPSSDVELKPVAAHTEAVKPAKIKDEIRTKAGANTGLFTWCETVLKDAENPSPQGGETHPGARACFGSSHSADGKTVIVWGGVDASGTQKGDGWLVQLE